MGVGVATGAIVAPCPVKTGSFVTNSVAARTKAPPSRATDKMVTMSVPVVRIAPRRTWVLRSDSHERWARRRARSSRAASRILSSRPVVGRGIGREPRSAMTSVLLPISAVQTAQPLT